MVSEFQNECLIREISWPIPYSINMCYGVRHYYFIIIVLKWLVYLIDDNEMFVSTHRQEMR